MLSKTETEENFLLVIFFLFFAAKVLNAKNVIFPLASQPNPDCAFSKVAFTVLPPNCFHDRQKNRQKKNAKQTSNRKKTIIVEVNPQSENNYYTRVMSK